MVNTRRCREQHQHRYNVHTRRRRSVAGSVHESTVVRRRPEAITAAEPHITEPLPAPGDHFVMMFAAFLHADLVGDSPW